MQSNVTKVKTLNEVVKATTFDIQFHFYILNF